MARDGPFTGHAHFWERAMSRRQFLATTAAASGAAVTAPVWLPSLVEASSVDPTPIPGGFGGGFRVFLGAGVEPSTIFNYRGVTGVATVRGKGTGWNTVTGETTRYSFDSDNRFMKGEYIGVNGQRHRGTFGFV